MNVLSVFDLLDVVGFGMYFLSKSFLWYTMHLFCLRKWNVRGRGGGCEFYGNCFKYVTLKLLIKKNLN
jgi:hypothetical protein